MHSDALNPTYRILIADDEQNLRLLIQTTLEARDSEVLLAGNGRAALEMARHHLPHVILLDWMMPELNGLEVLQELRRDTRLRHIPVIMLTARGQEQDRKAALESGASAFLVKPFSPLELMQKVQEVLRRPAGEVNDGRERALRVIRGA